MRMVLGGVAVLLAALAIAACGDDDEGDATTAESQDDAAQTAESTSETVGDGEVTFELAEENGSGESGTATMTPVGQRTRIVLSLENPTTDSQPAHVHQGSCGPTLDPEPFIGLQNVIDGESETVVNTTMSELTGGGLAINIHQSNSALDQYVACGDMPTESDGGSSGDDVAASEDESPSGPIGY
jgi:Cu/Zn superoxide dismutase